ncbi:hypothetical protein G5I_03141 [Acromyrmex echinatior]|uniref:Uncharacterized protein n=1 Tax=Acromyrmex echinatior TaxID=103372 RepID=F4WC67_ACREC|nr:hypothetical protein G5I_03141 [Acromyrmex echinatior]
MGCTLARYAPKRKVVTVNGRLLGQSQANCECDPTTSPTGSPTLNSTVVARLFFRTRLADLCLTVWPIGLPCDCREDSFGVHKKTTQTDVTGPSYIRAGGESGDLGERPWKKEFPDNGETCVYCGLVIDCEFFCVVYFYEEDREVEKVAERKKEEEEEEAEREKERDSERQIRFNLMFYPLGISSMMDEAHSVKHQVKLNHKLTR